MNGMFSQPLSAILKTSYVSFWKVLYYNEHCKAKGIEGSIVFAATRQVWQQMIS
jgi:hypothetical protein